MLGVGSKDKELKSKGLISSTVEIGASVLAVSIGAGSREKVLKSKGLISST